MRVRGVGFRITMTLNGGTDSRTLHPLTKHKQAEYISCDLGFIRDSLTIAFDTSFIRIAVVTKFNKCFNFGTIIGEGP